MVPTSFNVSCMLTSVVDIMHQAWRVYSAAWKKFTLLMVWYVVMYFLVTWGRDILIDGFFSQRPGVGFVIFVVTMIAAGLLSLWSTMASMIVAKEIFLREKPTSLGVIFKAARQKVWAALLISVMLVIAIALGSLLLIVPGIIFTTWYAFAFQRLVFHDERGFMALGSSKDLVVNRFFPVLWRLVMPTLAFALMATVLQYVILAPAMWPNLLEPSLSLRGLLFNQIIVYILYAIVLPLSTISITILYLELAASGPAPAPAAPTPEKSADKTL